MADTVITTSVVLDLILVGILAFFLIRGLAKGLIMTLAGAAGLIAGVFGGSYLAKMFSKPVSDTLLLPWVTKTLGLAAQDAQLPTGTVVTGSGQLTQDASSSITGVMEASKLPGFSISGVLEGIGKQITDTGTDLLNAAANVISERIAYILLFIIAFALIQIIIFVIFKALDLVSKAPGLNTLNKWSGGILGLVTGSLLILVLMWFAGTFIAPATKPGAILSEEALAGSYIAKHYQATIHMLLP